MNTIKQSTVQRVLSVNELPTLPEVMSRIVSVADDDGSDAMELTRILSCDPAISARVLRLANSPFYGARYDVDSIQRAIVIIGFEAVKQLSLATTVLHAFNRASARGFDAHDFWLHAMGAAKSARLLTSFLGNVTGAEACFSAAILHDLGKFVLSLNEDNDYPVLVEESRESGVSLRHLEMERFHISHDQLGAWLLERWSFPPVIVEGLACQYQPETHRGANHKAVCVLALCSDMAREAGLGSGSDFGPVAFNAYAMKQLGLTATAMKELIQVLANERDEMAGAVSVVQA